MKNVKTIIIVLLTGWSLCFSHHAREYIDLESYHIGEQGEKVFYTRYDYLVEDPDDPDLDHWELTYGMSYTITSWLMTDVHFHLSKFGKGHTENKEYSPFLEAVAIVLQSPVTPAGKFPVDIGVSFSYELPFNRSKELLKSEPLFKLGLILSKEFDGHYNISANIFYEKEGETEKKEWAAGAKVPLTADPHGVSAGIEIFGSFENVDKDLLFLPGIYLPIVENVIFKTGLAVDKNFVYRKGNITLSYIF